MRFLIFIVFAFILSQLQSCKSIDYKQRVFFQAKYEAEKLVISGAGQSNDAFKNFCSVMDDSTKPVIYMNYCGLKGNNYKWLTKNTQNYNWMIIPQIGLSMTHDGEPEKHYEQDVAAGKYDTNIISFCKAMKESNYPIFVRLGYEFNGHWNGYQPETFKAAFRKVVNMLRENNVTNVAIVWCASGDGSSNFMDFYPGDEYVDWWGMDIFGKKHFADSSFTYSFYDSAFNHNKPVMIGESTPRRVGVLEGKKSWNEWFKPYFKVIHDYPQIKAFSYINWEWSKYPMWKDWGDGRIEMNKYVTKMFVKELKKSLYFNGSTPEKTKRILNIK